MGGSVAPVHSAAYLLLIPVAIGVWAAVKAKSTRFVLLAPAFTLTAHGLAHSLKGLLLPIDRTSIFIAFFLSVLSVYGTAHAPVAWARHVATGVLCGRC